MAQPSEVRAINEYRVEAYAGKGQSILGNGSANTLTTAGYATLAEAQVDFPTATALTEYLDRHAIQRAIDVCNAAGGGTVKLGPKTYRTDATITQKNGVSVEGVSGETIIQTSSVSYDGWTISAGTVMTNSVVTRGIWVKGPNAVTLANEASLGTSAAFKYDGSTQCRSYDCSASNYAIGLDLINNNYNCAFYNFTVPRFSATIWGIYLRNGGNSGSDLYFYNPQLHCHRSCWVMDGGGGGYYIYGGQFGAGNLLTSADDATGVIQLCYRLSDGSTSGTLSQVLFDGCSLEGWHYTWGIRIYNRTNVTFRNMSFQATETSASKALGLMKVTTADNSKIVFDSCEIGGGGGSYFANDPFVSIAGSTIPNISERDWRLSYSETGINANGRVISGFGVFWGLMKENSITSGRTEQYSGYMMNGRWLRKSDSAVFEWADNPDGTWKQIGVDAITLAITDEVTAFTAGSGKATYRMPYAFKLLSVRASLSTAQTSSGSGGIVTVDINEGGTSLLGTKLSIDNGEKTSTTAASAATITDSNIADDAEITVDIDQVGDGTARGLKVTLIGYRN